MLLHVLRLALEIPVLEGVRRENFRCLEEWSNRLCTVTIDFLVRLCGGARNDEDVAQIS